ncbi:MAG: PrsW family glutamic-type intramembrane protease, partial [Candidatus Omnitrophota bacterium]
MLFGLIALGVLPSVIWLSIYLREDEHPEPNRFILKTFFLGALLAPVAAGIEFLLIDTVRNFSLPAVLVNFLIFFVFIGIVEEYCKFLAVRIGMLKNPVFDEPTDAMIYLIVSGLGFAALENVLAIFHFIEGNANIFGEAFEITALRFLSST